MNPASSLILLDIHGLGRVEAIGHSRIGDHPTEFSELQKIIID